MIEQSLLWWGTSLPEEPSSGKTGLNPRWTVWYQETGVTGNWSHSHWEDQCGRVPTYGNGEISGNQQARSGFSARCYHKPWTVAWSGNHSLTRGPKSSHDNCHNTPSFTWRSRLVNTKVICGVWFTQKWLAPFPWGWTEEWGLPSLSSGTGDWAIVIFSLILYWGAERLQEQKAGRAAEAAYIEPDPWPGAVPLHREKTP